MAAKEIHPVVFFDDNRFDQTTQGVTDQRAVMTKVPAAALVGPMGQPSATPVVTEDVQHVEVTPDGDAAVTTATYVTEPTSDTEAVPVREAPVTPPKPAVAPKKSR